MKKFEYVMNGQEPFDVAKEKYLQSLTRDERRMNQSFEEMTVLYKTKHSEFMSGRSKAADIIDDVTQPYYQSMLLSRKRLEQKNIQMDVFMKTHPFSERMPFNFKNDERCYAGERQDSLKLRRLYYQNGRLLKKKADSATCRISFLKSRVNSISDEAVCPNCGYNDKLSSFIDGCDACGSSFTVKDFEPKISGFSLRRNRVNEFYKSIFRAVKIYFAVFLLILFLVITGTIILDTEAVIGVGIICVSTFVSSIAAVFAASFFYVLFTLRANIWDTVENAEVAGRIWKWFSADDFLQNLEYKIQNICMASDKRQIDAFFSGGIDELPDYSDVIDCDIDNVKFVSAETYSSGYHVDLSLVLRLTENKKNKISERYESVSCSVFGKKGVVDKEITALREYKCQNCGASVNLLEGAECSYCGTKYDYSDHNWVFESYRKEKNKIHRNKKTTIILTLVYTVIYLAMLLGIYLHM